MLQRTLFYHAADERSLWKNEREKLKWMTMSILLLWHWELVIVTYNVQKKRLNPFFRLQEASEVLKKFVLGVWSDNFTAAFIVNFIVTVFVRDIEAIQNKVLQSVCELEQLVQWMKRSRVVLICMTSDVANLPEGPPI